MDKSKVMFIVIIALLVVLIGIISFLTFRTMSMISSDGDQASIDEPSQVTNYVPVTDIVTVDLSSPISTNLKTGPSGVPYAIRVSISIGVNNTDPKEAQPIIDLLSTKEAIVRDTCLSVLTNMTNEELMAGDQKAIISQAILLRLQEEFETNLICKVFISDIYIN